MENELSPDDLESLNLTEEQMRLLQEMEETDAWTRQLNAIRNDESRIATHYRHVAEDCLRQLGVRPDKITFYSDLLVYVVDTRFGQFVYEIWTPYVGDPDHSRIHLMFARRAQKVLNEISSSRAATSRAADTGTNRSREGSRRSA